MLAEPLVIRPRVLRHSAWDALLIALSLAHGLALLAVPSVLLVAVGLWWNANTVAHNFIHLPFFRTRLLNRVYSAYLTLVLGVPQSLWRQRHLAHHAGRPLSLTPTPVLAFEVGLVVALWATLAVVSLPTLVFVYVPGWIVGLGLCQLQGHYEHARGTTSHYGRLYNALFFNDGYHVEHHRRPSAHWTRLGRHRQAGAPASRWPPVLRWLDRASLNGLERVVLASPRLQRFVVHVHERAFRRLLPEMHRPRTVTIVGGGLFPRTALILRQVWPTATLTIVDADARHLDMARAFLGNTQQFTRGVFDPHRSSAADLVIVPLAYVGDRRLLYTSPPARVVLIHDWIWARRGQGVVVSWLLLKRLNLVRGADAESERSAV